MTLARLIVLLMLLPHPLAAQLRAVDGLAALEAGDVEGARAIWAPLAERGDVLAQFNLGVLVLETDPDNARALFAQAAAQGHLPAQQALGELALAAGNWAQARRWLRVVAQAGDAQAQMRLAMMLDQGLGGPVNPAGAALWYQRAAENGVAEAAFALGAFRAEAGALEEAAQWFARASAQGHLAATHNLAVAHAQGAGVAQDLAKARALYLQAAQGGHSAAMYNLALMQARGQGGEARFRHALAWALNADAAGHPGAADLVEALREVMTEVTIAEAAELMAACRAGEAECR